MFSNAMVRALVAAILVACAADSQAVTVDLTLVDDAGNAPDTRYGSYGAVADWFMIGTYEITAGQYTEFLDAVAKTDPYGLYDLGMWTDDTGCKIQQSGPSGDYDYTVAAQYADRPVNYVSFWDAARFCNWLHNGQGSGSTESGAYVHVGNQTTFAREPDARYWIPNEDEWYKAAYYKGGGINAGYWEYPTADNVTPGRNMTEGTKPGNNANFWGTTYPIDSGTYYTTIAGEFELSWSAYGTFDQGGNVWEWNETAFAAERGMRGGCFGIDVSTLAASYRNSYTPTAQSGAIGFRVAYVPEPGGIAAILAGAATLLLGWRLFRLR